MSRTASRPPSPTAAASSASWGFDRAIAADSAYGESYIHAIWLALELEDTALARRYIGRYPDWSRRLDDGRARAFAAIQAVLDGQPLPVEALAAALRDRGARTLREVTLATLRWPDSGEVAVQAAHAGAVATPHDPFFRVGMARGARHARAPRCRAPRGGWCGGVRGPGPATGRDAGRGGAGRLALLAPGSSPRGGAQSAADGLQREPVQRAAVVGDAAGHGVAGALRGGHAGRRVARDRRSAALAHVWSSGGGRIPRVGACRHRRRRQPVPGAPRHRLFLSVRSHRLGPAVPRARPGARGAAALCGGGHVDGVHASR